ncbi:MAG: flagellar M-ring protein FliF [Hyphomonadaceae bacterium]|nr:flagellar M-ring protein FliF [Hyphomonadaceae bacterium]MBX3510027.1 flagellar M-ring protein FliF [Hyphomonadaceae bacterium]
MNGISNLLLKAGPTRLFAALGIAAVVVAIIFTLVLRMGGEANALLFAGVEMRETAQITQRLEQADIPYELRGDGSSIYVPRSRVLDARMMLSADGLPSRGSIGYEIFDQPDALGQTQFHQNINRLRALEGELARTIASLDGIASARVHLVLPERQLFSREAEQPSASIVLGLRRDALTPNQVVAIRNLVASATPGLTANRVTILDETGRLLAAATDGEGASGEAIDSRQAAMEERIRRTVTDIVEGVVGAGNARVQVTAEMDFSRVSETSERFDPEGRVVRSTSTTEQTSSSAARAQGTSAGVNTPDATAAGGSNSGSQNSDNSSQETVNYEISRTTRTEISEGGRIRRLSVAVAVDGVHTPGAEGAEASYAPRSEEDMQRLQALVRSAVGFNAERGDVVEVVNTQFARAEIPGGAEASAGMFDNIDLMRILEIVAALIASLAFVFFVLRPLVGGLMRGGANAAALGGPGAQPALPGPGAPPALPSPDGAAALADGDAGIDLAQIQGRVRASSVRRVAEVVDQHPDESAQIIRGWLNNAL